MQMLLFLNREVGKLPLPEEGEDGESLENRKTSRRKGFVIPF